MLKAKLKLQLKPEVLIRHTTREVDQGLAQSAQYVRDQALPLIPVDTGALKDFTPQKRGFLTYIVGPNVFYGVYQEFGTRYMKGKFFMRHGLDQLYKNFSQFFQKRF